MDTRTLRTAARNVVCTVMAFGALAAVSTVHAVDARVYQLGDGGAVAPHLRLEFGSDNNPLRSNNGSEETMYLRLSPTVRYLVQRRNNRLELGYRGDYFQYFQDYCQGQPGLVRPGDCLQGSPDFDKASYQDHTLSLNGFLEVSKRVRATLAISQQFEHQPLGTGQSGNRSVLDVLTTPDNWNRRSARAEIAYGAYQARGEVRAGITIANREFESERNVDFDALSERSVAPDARLLYRIGTRTQLFAGLGGSQVRGGDSERDISRQIFGVEFDSSAITSGSIAFSNVTEDFLGNRRDLEYIGWNVEMTWRPRRFSTVTVGGGKQTERGLFNDNIGLTTNIDAEWVHFWKERISTRVQLGLEFNQDVDEFSSRREDSDAEDEAVSFRVEGNYNIRRWLDIGGFVLINSRNGRGDSRDFERTLIGFTANGTI